MTRKLMPVLASRIVLVGLVAMIATGASLSLLAQGQPIVGTARVTLVPNPASGANDTNFQVSVFVDLSQVTGQSPGGTTTPAVLGGYQIDLDFDRTRLRLDAVGGGSSTGFNSAPTATNLTTANAAGRVTMAAAQTNPNAPTGLVHVATLTFHAIAEGNASLSVSPRSLSSAAQGGSAGPTNIPGTGSASGVVIGSGGTLGTPSNPNPPNGATNVPSPTVTLSWSAASGATAYDVYFGTTSNPPLIGRTASTSQVVATSPGVAYFWRVVAVGSGGQTASGPVWSFTTGNTPQPPTPTPPPPPAACEAPPKVNVTGPNTVTSGQTYQINFTLATGATEYTLDESTDPAFPEDKTTSTTVTNLPFTVSFTHSVSTDTRYYYRVRSRRNTEGCNIDGLTSDTKTVLVSGIPPTLRVLVVVGSTPGAFGSLFKTAIQAHNPGTSPMTGRFVFRRQGQPGSDSDPVLPYTIEPGKTMFHEDFLPLFNLTGLGSVDVLANGTPPSILARIYNDAGQSGTTGMTLQAVDPEQAALKTGDTGLLLAPSDLTKFRFNIGVRSFAGGATMTVRLINPTRGEVKKVTKTYAPQFFAQQAASDFLEEAEVSPDDSIEFRIDSGSAIIYGTTTDNTTQDPSFQYARRASTGASNLRRKK